MSKCGRNLLGSFKTLAVLTLSAVTALSSSVRAGAQTTQTPSSYNFGNVAILETSLPEKITVKNTGAASITINSYGVTGGPYAISTANSTCGDPGSLGAGATCTIGVTVEPTLLGPAAAGTLTINTTASNSPQHVTFSATGVEPVTLSSDGLAFSPVVVGETSSALSVTLANNQPTSVTISALSVTPGNGFTLAPSTTCSVNGQLTARSSCVIGVTFTPGAIGSAPASVLSVTTTQSATPITIPLTGTGIAPTLITPTSLSFGSQAVGQTSLIKTFTLKNEQSTALAIGSIVAPAGGFAIDPSTNCPNPGSLGAGLTCTVGVTFTPTAVGAAPTGSVVITTNASNSPQDVPVTGTGTLPVSISATTVPFGNVALNQTSAIKTVTVANNQTTQTVSFSTIAPGANSQYAIDPSTTCSVATPLAVKGAAGSSCTLAFTFTPTSIGAQTGGSASVGFNASNTPLTVSFSGAGVEATSVSPTYIGFGDQIVNTPSATKTVTINNLQSAALNITQLVFSGPFSLDTSSITTCPIAGGTVSGTLNANSTCKFGVIFTPTAPVAVSGGEVTVISSSPSGPLPVSLAGSGELAVRIYPTPLAFSNVAINIASAPKNVTVFNNQSVNLDFTSITVPAPYSIYAGTTTCVVGTPVLPGKNCVISITVEPTAIGAVPAGSLTLNDDAPTSPQTAALTATGVAQVQIYPTPLTFTALVVSQETTGTVSLTNFLPNPIQIDSVASFTGPYTFDTSAVTTCPLAPAAVAPGATCKIGIDVTPTAVGSQPGSATVTYNVSGSSTMANLPITLAGNSFEPVAVYPSPEQFPLEFVGVGSPVVPMKVWNRQSSPLTISAITVSGTNAGDFAISSNLCPTAPATLPAYTICTVNMIFTPSASGYRTATLNVADNALGSPQTVTLSGEGNAPLLVTPLSITTFHAYVGAISAYSTVTITNQTTTPYTLNAFQLNGDFQETSSTCGATLPYSLAGGASCSLTISFTPTIGGTRGGQLQVIDTAATSPQVINLQGIGYSPLTLNPTSLVYSAQLVNSTSPAKLVTLTNHESQSETFSLTPSGPFSATTNCTTGTIAANSNCNIYVNYSPTTATPASQSGSITVTDSAPGGNPGGAPVVLSLTGTATATNPAPAVAVVSPGAAAGGPAATIVNVTITGNGWTHFSNSSVITFPVTSNSYASDITVNSVTAISPNTINASITLAASPVFGARNIRVVTPLSGGGSETATLNSAFIISDPTQTFEITSITPGVGTQGQGYLGIAPLTVDIVATGTNFVQGTTYANFGDGVTVESLDITSPTTAMATLAITNTTPVGYRSVTMVTGGQVANSVLVNNNPIFYIGPNSATLISVTEASETGGVYSCSTTPVSEPQSFAGPICLTATGTHFLQNATTASITGGVTVGDLLVQSPTVAIAQVIVPANATIGVDSVTVATGGEIATLGNSFTVTGSTPALISVTPNAGKQGQSLTVTVTGNSFTNFATCPGSVLTADFTGVISSPTVTVNPANHQQVTIPISINENAPTGGITANLTCGGSGSATIFPFSFTIQPSSASIVSVTPSSVPQGGQVTLNVTGSNTDWSQADTMSAFYPTPIATPLVNETTILSPTSAKLAISVPTNTPVGTYCFYMATGGQIVSACIQVYANTPTLTMNPANGLVPASGSVPISVSFTGQFTHFSQAGTVPVISGEGVTLTSFVVNTPVSAMGTINIAAGAATGPRLVTFTTGGEIVTTYFNVTTIPVGIVSESPWHGPQSTTMNVAIVGLNTHFVSGSTQVIFGGPQITVNTVTVTNATHLTANITTSYTPPGLSLTPTPPGWNTVYINDPTEQLLTGFLVDAPATPSLVSACVTADLPTCVSSAPQGSGGTNVTITGSLTSWVQGSSELVMGAGITVADLVITSPTTATATISVSPTAPVGGNSVIMITPLAGGGFEYDSGVGFSVTPSAAYISTVALPACATSTDANFIADFCNNGTVGIPPVVSQLQTSNLNITGTGTHWLQGETTFSFGPGVVLDQTTIIDPTHASVEITVLSSAPVGFATATASTDGENASLQQAIDIEEGSPTFLAFSPQGAQQGATLNVEVLGRFTNWTSATPPVAEFNQDITINSVTVDDSETLTLNVTVSPWAYVDTGSPCGHVLTITSGSEQVSSSQINDNFCVSQGAEEITGVSPNASGQGTSLQVTITGSQTNFLAGQTQVSFGDPGIVAGVPINVTPTSMQVPVVISTSATTGYHNVTVTTYGQVATQVDAFSVVPTVAQLVEAISDQAEQGVQNLTVRLIGQYTHFSTSSTATFGPGITVVGTPTWVSDTEIDAVIDISPISYVGVRDVTVSTPGISCANQPPTTYDVAGLQYQGCTPGVTTGTGTEIVNANVFSIILGPAIITGMAPNTGNEGQEIVATITGLDTHWQQNFTQFYIAGGGSDITINDVIVNSPTSATVDISISPTANAGPRSIYMVTAGESLTDQGAFVVTGGVPAISYLTPNSAQPGTAELQVTVVGNAYTQWAQGSSTVSFGTGITVLSQEVDDSSHITADITIGATCTSPGVPTGCAQYGYRTVVVQTGTQGLTGSFDVVAPPPPPTPYVWYEAPSSGIPGQTVSVYFYGVNTQWNPNPTSGTTLTGWDAHNITINSYQIVSPTEALVNITINSNAPAETMGLTFTTTGTSYNDGSAGVEVDDASFTIVIAQPVLSIVDPGSGLQGAQNITVNVLGQFTAFDNTTTFSIGGPASGITVNNVNVISPTVAQVTLSIGQETPTGGYSVVATTPDAPAIAQVVSGAGFSVTPSLATILNVMPNTSAQGTQITVNVTGFDTHWSPATTFSFGAGIVVTGVTVNSETTATLTLAIPPFAPEGTTYATATTGGEVATLNQAFVITAGTPYLLSSGPGSVEQQGAAVFTILAQATNWSSVNPPVVSYGGDITLGPVQVTSPTTITVQGAVSPTAVPGYRNLTVTTGTQVLSINNAVYIAPGPAVINSVTPSTGGQGVQFNNVIINGINTHWVQGVTALNFPGVLVNNYTVSSPTTITASITVGLTTTPGQVNVTATTLGEVATEINAFTITQTQAELAFVNPSSLPQGQTQNLTLTGIDTNFVSGTSVVSSSSSGIRVNSTTVNSPTSVTTNVTISPSILLGYKNITVTTGAQIVSSNSLFQVTSGPAAISDLNPANGGEGQSVQVVVTGSQTHFTQGVTTASFSGGISVTGVTVQSQTSATVGIYIPVGVPLGTYNASLITGGEVATILNGFTVNVGSPVIANVTPPTGTQGLTTNVTLTGGFTTWAQGTSVANFGSGITVNLPLVVNSATSLTANITISPTATLGSRTVTVTTGSQVAQITGGFTVLAGAPTLVTSAPGSGQAGTTLNLIITGDFTNFQQAFSTVSLGDGITTNFITVNSPTQITANITIPSNAATGSTYVSVTTLGTTLTLNAAFTVLPGTPVITQINPNVGTTGQTDLNVTIIGLYTNWVNGTTVANFDGPSSGITVNSTTVNSPTNLTANISISGTAPLGPETVTTTTHSEVENVAGGFTVQSATPPSPQVISLSPGAAAGGMPLNSVINAVFSEPMLRSTITSSTVLLTLTSNPNGNVSVAGTVTLDPTGRIVTFAPNALLAPNSTYYFNMTGSIQSATGIAFSNYAVDLYTTSATAISAPTVVAANPPASSTVGTNVLPELEFSADMQQGTETGMTVSTGGNPVAGTYSWNANPYCCGSGWAQPGTVLTFTPTAALTPGTTYKVAWNNTMTDTAGNAAVPGSFTFTTGSGPDTVDNNVGSDFNGLTNVGTNFAPTVTFSKPINPIDIWGGWNSGTLLLYDNDGSKYIEGTVTVAPNGLSATFTPTVDLLPDTYYHVYMAGGDYDADGNYLYGNNFYFTTGTMTDTTAPTGTVVSPANASTSVPLNSQIMVKFSTPINDNNINVITVTPSGGSAITGTTSLAGDLVTLTFVPNSPLQPGKVFTVNVSGFTDIIGNNGTPFTSTFTTAASSVVLNVSTGINSSGQAILVGDTPDPHWSYLATTTIPAGESDILYPGCNTANYASNTNLSNCTLPSPSGDTTLPTPAALSTVASGEADWYGGWVANGPNSSWIAINPLSATGNTAGFYYTSFTMPSPLPSSQICIVGSFAHDDSGLLAVNGTPILADASYNGGSPAAININITAYLVPGVNYLNYAPGATDNSLEGVNLNAVIETCGASVTGGLSLNLSTSTPSNNATNVATSTSIVMNFNNAVDPATVNATTLPIFDSWNSNYQIAGTYTLSNNNTTVTFKPASPFPVNSNIWVGACYGPLDLAGDTLTTGCWTQELNFWTGPTVTPAGTGLQVAAFSPLNNATNVGLRAPVYATFNRSINQYSINNSDFGLYDGEGVSQGNSQNAPWCDTNSWTHSQDDTTFYWNCYPLPSSAQMTALLNNGISDVQGDTLVPFTSSFTTTTYDSNTNGSIIGTRPGNAASGVNPSLPLILFSNLPINASTANSGIQVAQNNVILPGTVTVLDGGYTLEFVPSAGFANGALIQWWTTGSLFDTTYNTPITGDSGYYYTAGSTSTLVPALQVASPSQSVTAPINSIVDLQFNVPLNPATVNNTNIYLYDQQTGLNVAGTYSMPQPNEVRIVPSANFTQGHYIFVYVTTGLQSTTSVPFGSNTWIVYFYANSPADSTLPVVQSAVPYNGATNVAVNDTPGVIFSKPIDPISVTSTTFQVLKSGVPLAGYFWFNSNDTRADFVPNTPLPPSSTLTMSINGVTDLEGHPVTFSSAFTTGTVTDFTAPSVLFSSVNSNDSIPTNSTIAVTFSEPMDASTFANGQPGACGNFYIYDELSGDGINCIATTLTWNSSQTIAYLTPTAPLAAGRQYYFYIYSGTDLAGNVMNGDSFYFYADFGSSGTAPSAVAFNPIGGQMGLGTNAIVEAQFSAPIDPNYMSGVTLTYSGGTVPANVYAEAGNTVIQIIPTAPLLPTTTYTMNIVGVQDPAGNVVGTVTNSFTTGATYNLNSPTVVESVPVDNATVGINYGTGTSPLAPKFVFNEPLNPLTVNSSSFRIELTDSGQYLPATVTLSPNGLEVTITPLIPLLPNTEYQFSGGWGVGPYDQDGNYYDMPWYYFWTTDGTVTTHPTVTISPATGSTGIPLNTLVQVAVSTPVDPTTITQSSITLKNGSTPVTGTVTLANSQLLIFTPSTSASDPAQTYLGCYNDAQDNIRTLNGYEWSSSEMTIEQCVSSCSSRGYQYAAVQDASYCFCGSGNFSTQGVSTSCNMACTGNGAETCGGSGANSVYTAQAEVVPQNLASGTSYTVNVSGFSDANGNTVTPASSSFTTAGAGSASYLYISSYSPTNGSTNNSGTGPITVVFNNPLDPTTVNGNTLLVTLGGCCGNEIAGAYALSINNTEVTFTPSSPFPAGGQIYVSVCGGPYDVLGQQAYGGCDYNLFSFTINPGGTYTTALKVTGVSPADLATNVGRDQSVSVTFNNSLQSGSANGYNSQLYAGQSIEDAGSYTLSADNQTLTFNVGALYNNTNYTILFPTGGVTDMWGNTLTQDFVSTFTTMADPATGNGSVIGTTPSVSTSSSVPVNSLLTLYLNRPVNTSTLPGQLTVTVNGQVFAGTVQADASGYQVQFLPAVQFPNGAAVQWFFSGSVQDIYGDYFNGDSGYFYTVPAVNAATAAPTLVAASPTYGSSLAPTNTEIDLEFSQPILASTVGGGNVYFNTGTAATVSVLPAPNNNVIRVVPNAVLTAGDTYYVCASTNVTGTNGVPIVNSCWNTYFTVPSTATGPDTTPGTVTLGPPDMSQNVGTNAYIRFQFSKPVDRTTVNSNTIAITTGGNPIPGSFSYNYSGNDVIGANFSPLNPLPQSSTIKVAVSGILDYAGNQFNEPTITFQTAAQPDYTNPNVTLDFPYGTGGIATNASFTCLYSEPMDPSSITPGNTYIYSYTSNGSVPVTYSFASDLMSVTMKPVSPLLQNSEYYYRCYSAIDLTGNGQNNGYSLFYTAGGPVTTGPTVVGVNPPNGMTNVPINTQNGPWVNSSLGILFNEPVNGDTLGQITLTPQGGSAIPIGVTPEDGNYMVWVSLPYPLSPNTQYTFNITGVTDLNGNAMTAAATSTFTTGAGFDWNNASVTATSPANGVTTTGVPTSVTVTFSEALAPILINTNEIYIREHNTTSDIIPATISVSSSATPSVPTTVTITPTTPLLDATIYDIYYYPNPWWLTNISGINASNNYGVLATFTTGTGAAANGACGSANGQTFTSAQLVNPNNLCSTGTASGQSSTGVFTTTTTSGTYSWTCDGNYGGTNASCSATIKPGIACVAPPSGLVSWWPGNDNATDVVSGNNGTLENGAAYGLGEVDDAFNLTGNTAQASDQYVEINGGTMPTNLEIQNNLTLSAWIYPTAYPVNYGSGAIGIIAGSQYDGSYSGATLYYDARVNPDGNENVPVGHIGFNLGSGSTWYIQDTQTQVPLNQWTLVTGVATSGQQSQVYFNGVLQPSNSGNYTEIWPGTVSYTNAWFQIGQETDENRPFTGLIDEVQVYNTSLTQSQIKAIYNAGSIGLCQP